MYSCYRHNSEIPHAFARRDDSTGRLVDGVMYDILQHNSTVRSSAVNVYKRMVRGCERVEEFKKFHIAI